ncbi:hypothetical protein CL619_02330 [archaeon]|nr:hypothetical protein [archaeon]
MFSNKVSGFLAIAVLVAVSLFAYSFFAGSDSAIAGEAVASPLCLNESDSGFDVQNFGSIYLPKPRVELSDTCLDGTILKEYVCPGKRMTSVDYDCSVDGNICSDGACVSGSICTDSDGGFDVNMSSAVSNGTVSNLWEYNEYCMNDETLVEFYCDGTDLLFEEVDCDGFPHGSLGQVCATDSNGYGYCLYE